jgi:hypothetical protein
MEVNLNMKYNKSTIATILIMFAVLAGIGAAVGQIGRFTPTHAIVMPVYCGACHPEQIAELNATTHLVHFASGVLGDTNNMNAPAAPITSAEAISDGCMMCHNTWDNRGKIFLTNASVSQITTTGLNGTPIVSTQLSYNDVSVLPTSASTLYNVAVSLGATGTQVVRLGGNVSSIVVTVQNPGTSVVPAGTVINGTTSGTGVTLDQAVDTNLTALNASSGAGTLKITYKTGGTTMSYQDAWGQLSATSPQAGLYFSDQSGKAGCGNQEKGLCHAVEITVAKASVKLMPDNYAGVNGTALGGGIGVYFNHDMSYTSEQYAAKQVKLCGVCHVDKLPPMDALGNPIPNTLGTIAIKSKLLDTTNITVTSPAWAHAQVQCINCHAHAGIGSVAASAGGLTGVTSPN